MRFFLSIATILAFLSLPLIAAVIIGFIGAVFFRRFFVWPLAAFLADVLLGPLFPSFSLPLIALTSCAAVFLVDALRDRLMPAFP